MRVGGGRVRGMGGGGVRRWAEGELGWRGSEGMGVRRVREDGWWESKGIWAEGE